MRPWRGTPLMMEIPKLAVAILAFTLGACVGSFVSVVSFRLPRGLSVIRPRSFCPACGQPLPAWANVPLFGYTFLRGRCAMCHGAISLRYPLCELALGAAALSLSLRFGVWDALARFSLCAALLAVSLIDLESRIIPDVISLPGIGAGILCASLLMPEIGLKSSLLGIFAGGGLLWILSEVYRVARKREGLGFGDVKLLAMVGAYLGWPGALFTIFFGSLIGSVTGLLIVAVAPRWLNFGHSNGCTVAVEADVPQTTKRWRPAIFEPVVEGAAQSSATALRSPGLNFAALMHTAIPFGPFLSLAAASYAVFQPELWAWYFG
jgi:leader peptidase (prepilin peptidase)/N-methyltransferase